jgi:hypothetical protein
MLIHRSQLRLPDVGIVWRLRVEGIQWTSVVPRGII